MYIYIYVYIYTYIYRYRYVYIYIYVYIIYTYSSCFLAFGVLQYAAIEFHEPSCSAAGEILTVVYVEAWGRDDVTTGFNHVAVLMAVVFCTIYLYTEK